MIAQYSGPDRKLEYLFQHAKEVSLSPILTTGTPLATLTIDGQSYTLYCTTGGGSGSTVSYNSLITSGTALGELTIDGIKYTIYSKDSSKVAYSATQTSGTQIGTLTIDGTPYVLYAPNGGGGGSSTLAGLSDVDISSPVDGQILRYDGVNQEWVNSDDSSRPQTASGTFTTGANQYDKVEINCGFRPDYVQVILPFSQSDTVATYDARVSITTSTWHIPQEGVTYTLTLGEAQGETGISDITDTGFKFRCNAGNTRNIACTYIASKVASGSLYSETILFTGGTPSDTTFTLSDTITHYNTINVYYRHNDGIDDYIEVKSYPASFLHSLVGTSVNVLGLCNGIWYYYFHVTDDTHFAYSKSNAGYICDIIGVTS